MQSAQRLRHTLQSYFHRSGTTGAPFQVLSDLHLEVGQQYTAWSFPQTAPYLILAGDIGRLKDYDGYLDFLATQTDRFSAVFLVLGNHEFYGLTHAEGLAQARRLEQEPRLKGRLTLLHCARVDLPDSNVTILGCTLWSKIADTCRDQIQAKVNDFHHIADWTTHTHDAQHVNDLAWLQEKVAAVQRENVAAKDADGGHTARRKRKMLIVTHHAPCVKGTSHPRFDGSDTNSIFATDLIENTTVWKGVSTWIYGHTHYSADFRKRGIRVVSNQRGYVLPGARTQDLNGSKKKEVDTFNDGLVLRV